jgi:hypothetical protein
MLRIGQSWPGASSHDRQMMEGWIVHDGRELMLRRTSRVDIYLYLAYLKHGRECIDVLWLRP